MGMPSDALNTGTDFVKSRATSSGTAARSPPSVLEVVEPVPGRHTANSVIVNAPVKKPLSHSAQAPRRASPPGNGELYSSGSMMLVTV